MHSNRDRIMTQPQGKCSSSYRRDSLVRWITITITPQSSQLIENKYSGPNRSMEEEGEIQHGSSAVSQ